MAGLGGRVQKVIAQKKEPFGLEASLSFKSIGVGQKSRSLRAEIIKQIRLRARQRLFNLEDRLTRSVVEVFLRAAINSNDYKELTSRSDRENGELKLPSQEVLDGALSVIASRLTVKVKFFRTGDKLMSVTVSFPSITELLDALNKAEASFIVVFEPTLGTSIRVDWVEWFIFGTQRNFKKNVLRKQRATPPPLKRRKGETDEELAVRVLLTEEGLLTPPRERKPPKRVPSIQELLDPKRFVNSIVGQQPDLSVEKLVEQLEFEDLGNPVLEKFRGTPNNNVFTRILQSTIPSLTEILEEEIEAAFQ